jgi:hypothetical protein
MKVLATLGGRLDDFLNPIVVKELRQAVRSRFVSGVLMLLLVIQLLVVGLFVMFRAAAKVPPGLDALLTSFSTVLIPNLLAAAQSVR